VSVQCGRWNFTGEPVSEAFLHSVGEITRKFGGDGVNFCIQDSIGMSFQSFCITDASPDEKQPIRGSTGILLTWDGRLDNREELIGATRIACASSASDAEIVLAAYQLWKTDCFARLVGDWSLALWDPTERSLLLAKDFIGTRGLFYRFETDRVTWSSVLDPFVLLSEQSLELSEEFVAGYLATSPAPHVTPYVEVKSVPPATFVRVDGRGLAQREYWRPNPSFLIRYKSDAQYEDHFFSVFGEAVRRRLRTNRPVLAELSGGMDSTSVVCMADSLLADRKAEAPRLDTVSYYDDKEPNWNERPYFSLIEKKRGRVGYHIDVGQVQGAFLPLQNKSFISTPGCDQLLFGRIQELAGCLKESQSRVVLSGIGGDEFLGGVPTPVQELQDLWTRLQWRRFGRQLVKFGLQQRRPLSHLAFDVMSGFLPLPIRRLYKHSPFPNWLSQSFVKRNEKGLWADHKRVRILGAMPSFQANESTLTIVRRQVNCFHLDSIAHYRTAYPFLDRDLLAFLFAIPREQLVRPGERRSLMRRTLARIVPAEILTRKRKAYVSYRPLVLLTTALSHLHSLLQAGVTLSRGWVDRPMLVSVLDGLKQGHVEQLVPLINLVELELWLQTSLPKREKVAPHVCLQTPSSHMPYKQGRWPPSK
jgi:asparagine synthase (glutamine-hydrolysing)